MDRKRETIFVVILLAIIIWFGTAERNRAYGNNELHKSADTLKTIRHDTGRTR